MAKDRRCLDDQSCRGSRNGNQPKILVIYSVLWKNALESRTTSKKSHPVWRGGVGKVPPQAATRRLSTLPHARFCESAGVRSPRATHLVMAFENFLDAKRVLAVLGKRLARFFHPPSRQDALHRLPLQTAEGDFSPGRETAPRSISSASPTSGESRGEGSRGEASHGQRPLCPRAGGGHGLVPGKPASANDRAARPPVGDDAGPLRLLWRNRKRSKGSGMPTKSGGSGKEVVVTAGSPKRFHMEPHSMNSSSDTLYRQSRIVHRYAAVSEALS